MELASLLDIIFTNESFNDRPPVLIDVGASGSLPREWQLIAKYSVCVAFDPDDREMSFMEKEKSSFKKLFVINRIVTDTDETETDFYLTNSPYCSSALLPDHLALSKWQFEHLFDVQRKIRMGAVHLNNILKELKLPYVDWFKSDSQGLDLRLFKSLAQLQNTVLVVNFEPGFIDAYLGEDKISDVLRYMESLPFWISSFQPRGTKRLNGSFLQKYLNKDEVNNIGNGTVTSACWAEITYLNDFNPSTNFGQRELLLGCAFSLILKQYGFAIELALWGKENTHDKVFDDIITYIKSFDFSHKGPNNYSQISFVKKIIRNLSHRIQKPFK